MRRTTLLVAGLLLASLATAPVTMAHHADDESDANVQNTYYVTVEDDGLTVWEETNGHDGLQTSQTSYAAGDDGCVGEDDRERRGTCFAPSDSEVEV